MRSPARRGFAAERTTLAWRRSGLSIVAVGVVIARGVPTVGGVPGRPLIGLVVALLGGFAFAVNARQAAVRSRQVDGGRAVAQPAHLLLVSAATAAIALGAMVVVIAE